MNNVDVLHKKEFWRFQFKNCVELCEKGLSWRKVNKVVNKCTKVLNIMRCLLGQRLWCQFYINEINLCGFDEISNILLKRRLWISCNVSTS